MPVIEHILKSKADNRVILELTFDLGTLLSLGKLHLHISKTIKGLADAGSATGTSVRNFAKKVCPNYATLELPKELAARTRRRARKSGPGVTIPRTQKIKHFNYTTYKFHSLRDYAPTVIAYGSLDNQTTQIVRLFSVLWSCVMQPHKITHMHRVNKNMATQSARAGNAQTR